MPPHGIIRGSNGSSFQVTICPRDLIIRGSDGSSTTSAHGIYRRQAHTPKGSRCHTRHRSDNLPTGSDHQGLRWFFDHLPTGSTGDRHTHPKARATQGQRRSCPRMELAAAPTRRRGRQRKVSAVAPAQGRSCPPKKSAAAPTSEIYIGNVLTEEDSPRKTDFCLRGQHAVSSENCFT